MCILRPSEEHIIIRFWGVRGSLPSPGPSTVKYGGNTPCVSIDGAYKNGRRWTAIFDAGTGAHRLGLELAENENDIFLFLTHTHWDHIQGFPFFAPIYQPERKIYFSSLEQRRGLFKLLLDQMDGQRFPVTQEHLPANMTSLSQEQVDARVKEGYYVERLRVNHPGETHGFKLHIRDFKFVYIPDNEIHPPYDPLVTLEELVEFCAGADVLIHDAQYRPADMPAKRGWGHSVVDHVCDMALAARVKRLVLFHHDPDRSDEELDEMSDKWTQWMRERAPEIECYVAYEGLELSL